MRTFLCLTAATVSLGLFSTPASAEPLTGTLKKIKDNGYITLAIRDAAIPFSYYIDASGVPVGYSHDLQLQIVDALKRELQLPDLKVRYNLVTSQTRIPLIQNGTADLECGSTTNNVERQQQVDFSVGIFEVGARLLTRTRSGIKDFDDLREKNVVTTAGSTSERLLKKMNAERSMLMNVISAKDHGESFQMLESGRAVAFMIDDAVLAGEVVKAREPAEWHIVGTPQSYEIYGCMLRKNDTPFKTVVDNALIQTFASGRINDIYNKWFLQPIPPKNINLGLPMSDALKKLYAQPTDKATEQR
ncbi:glutamate/aspartate ABC transporter substrate-binding protein [Pseudomonas reactans]